MEKTTFTVLGMSCGHCKMAVEKALKAITGVADVVVDLAAAHVTVLYDNTKTNQTVLKEAVKKAGYDPE